MARDLPRLSQPGLGRVRGEEEGLKSLSRYIFPSHPSPITIIKHSSGLEFSRDRSRRGARTQFCSCGRILLFLRGKNASLQQLEVAALTWSPLPAVKTLLMLANTEKLQLLAGEDGIVLRSVRGGEQIADAVEVECCRCAVAAVLPTWQLPTPLFSLFLTQSSIHPPSHPSSYHSRHFFLPSYHFTHNLNLYPHFS